MTSVPVAATTTSFTRGAAATISAVILTLLVMTISASRTRAAMSAAAVRS
jgi:hypothetical protein